MDKPVRVIPLTSQAYHPYDSTKTIDKDGETFPRLCTRLRRQIRQGFIKLDSGAPIDKPDPIKPEDSKPAETETPKPAQENKKKKRKGGKGHQEKPATTES